MEEKRKLVNRDESKPKALMNASRLHSVIIIDTKNKFFMLSLLKLDARSFKLSQIGSDINI